MPTNELSRNDNATLWSIVIKTAYRKRRSKRKQNENSDKNSGNAEEKQLIQNNNHNGLLKELSNTNDNNNTHSNINYSVKNTGDELLKFLFDTNNHNDNNSNQNNNNSNNSNNFLNDIFSVDKLDGNTSSKLSLDCKGEIILEENFSLNNNGKPIDWLGLMEGRVYINENMAGTSLQPYSGAYKKSKGKRWSVEQTEKFYDALSLFGTDLMLVKSVFPEFTDKQVHDKFKAEEKKNKDKLDNILLNNKKKLTKEDINQFKLKYDKI